MGYESKYLNSALLKKIMEYTNPDKTTESMSFPFALFKQIMNDETIQPIISNSRTIKEKFKDLQDCHYITKGEVPRLDLDEVRSYLDKCGVLI